MSYSKLYRWVLVANLYIRNEKTVPNHVDRFTFEEVEEIIRNKFTAGDTQYSYQNDTKMMKIRAINQDDEDNLVLLLSIGDKNTPTPEIENYATGAISDVPVGPDEAFSLASHIVINKEPDGLSHNIMIEKMPGVNLSTVSHYLRHLLNDPNVMKTYQTDEGQAKDYRPIFDLLGHQSNTLREALLNGRLEDIEFVSYEEIEAGYDEYGYIQEQVRKARLVVNRTMTTDTVDGFFTNVRNRFVAGEYEKMYVRIKTNSGQTRLAEVEDINGDILSQYFCHNEFITDFVTPLDGVHKDINAEVVNKIIEKMP